ncbi:MAG TPA: UDP-N-acetylmuramoyl-L-alanyl-D-glutamate--2,6-diaminopimelate ligase, partial [Clostridiales bacterium]|nr:UDP-N-acetylmuramoyl-L-alanyl-D-glutamate--2,6-diaminopimelate ligase [Clostridiales bacterium]
MNMRISKLIKSKQLVQNNVDGNIEINNIAYDSRKVDQGDIFFAIAGFESDGHCYISDAVRNGATVIVGEKPKQSLGLANQIPYIQVSNSRKILSRVAANYYGNPARKMKVIGVTGTDGKTTTCNLISDILRNAGKKMGKVTTVDAIIDNTVYDMGVHVTTPDAITIQRYLYEMAQSDTEYAIIESTSHGLSQYRVNDCEFDIGVLTNITHEHFDYHGSYEAYREAKAILFNILNQNSHKNFRKFAILNADDDSYHYMKKQVSAECLSYGIKNRNVDLFAENISIQEDKSSFFVVLPTGKRKLIESKLLGQHNIYNSLAAIAVAFSQNVPFETIKNYFLEPFSPKGRLEEIALGQNYRVFIDYAHTENALRNILNLARKITKNRVILLFGLSGGPRDKTKRPALGKVAIENSDLVIITAVDWYPSEHVNDIVNQIAKGCLLSGGRLGESFWKISDREKAIEFTINMAEAGDVVIIAGKGHEKS